MPGLLMGQRPCFRMKLEISLRSHTRSAVLELYVSWFMMSLKVEKVQDAVLTSSELCTLQSMSAKKAASFLADVCAVRVHEAGVTLRSSSVALEAQEDDVSLRLLECWPLACAQVFCIDNGANQEAAKR